MCDILNVGYDGDGIDHNRTLHICKKENLKVSKDKYQFRCTSVLFFWETISRYGGQPYPCKLFMLIEILQPRSKKVIHSFLGIINCLENYLLATSELCEQLYRLTSLY